MCFQFWFESDIARIKWIWKKEDRRTSSTSWIGHYVKKTSWAIKKRWKKSIDLSTFPKIRAITMRAHCTIKIHARHIERPNRMELARNDSIHGQMFRSNHLQLSRMQWYANDNFFFVGCYHVGWFWFMFTAINYQLTKSTKFAPGFIFDR